MNALGIQFGPYELKHRLGVGGMAETFVALRRGPGGFQQKVCIKRILPAFEADPNFIRLFLREARVSACIRHSNIAQVVDFGVVDESHFLALELIEGMDLRALLQILDARNRRLQLDIAIYIGTEIARALDYAHAADANGKPSGVVHRDISPSNILISDAGEVKLTDFGIAKAMGHPATQVSRGIKGKIGYMAPEYAARAVFDARSDLFSLGVTLYECICGRRPFEGKSEPEILLRVMNGEFVPLHQNAPDVPKKLADAIESLIAAESEDRPANANVFLDMLQDFVAPPTARRTLGNIVCSLRPRTSMDDFAPAAVLQSQDENAPNTHSRSTREANMVGTIPADDAATLIEDSSNDHGETA